MNINAINSKIESIREIAFKSSNNQAGISKQQASDEFILERNVQNKKKNKNIWSYVATTALVSALIADIVVEHKIRVEEKAKKEAIQKEKELFEKLKNEAEEKAKKLEEEIKKQKEALENARKKEGTAGVPNINIEPPKL